MSLRSPPKEYLQGLFFLRVRERFEVSGISEEAAGCRLHLKCLGCLGQLDYPWLVKKPEESWTGDFGKRLKQNLLMNRAHRKCKERFVSPKAEAPHTIVLRAEEEQMRMPTTIHNNIQNIVIVNLLAVTRIGSTGEPLMCSDIPYPDEQTVRALLTHPESAVPEFVHKRYFTTEHPSISAPDATNTKLKLVQRDQHGNHWVDAPLDTTVDSIVYKTLDTLDDEFDAMKHNEGFKDWKRREGLTAHIGFDRTDAYQKLQSDVRDVLKTHGVPYLST